MSNQKYLAVKIDSIKVPEDRARSLDKQWAEALAAMFKDHGNKVAIEVRVDSEKGDGEGYVLVAGLHRLEAAKLCEWGELTVKVIEATSDKEAAEFRLHEVMENIGRRELTILDRAHHLFEFDRVMKELHPELRHGGDRKSDEAKENRDAIFALRLDVANSVGLSQRSIQASVKLWKDLSKATRERVDGTWLADHQAGLLALAAVGAKQQANILDVLDDPDNGVKSVADAITFLKQGRLATAVERRIGILRSALSKIDDTTFDRLMDLNAERVEAWMKRKGMK